MEDFLEKLIRVFVIVIALLIIAIWVLGIIGGILKFFILVCTGQIGRALLTIFGVVVLISAGLAMLFIVLDERRRGNETLGFYKNQ